VFTGLVEEVGSLLERRSAEGGGAVLTVRAARVLEGIGLGDSIAVNGVCLTATAWDGPGGRVCFDAVAETLRLTTLERLAPSAPLNLERALAVGDRVGGHYVTGHIDGRGKLLSRQTSGNGVVYRFACPAELLGMIAPKGSIAVDGISLTVVDVTEKDFSVWIVPHTQGATNLGALRAGDEVNLETDILAKYVNRVLRPTPGGISLQHLKEAGF
jgi:riboflavin synthase